MSNTTVIPEQINGTYWRFQSPENPDIIVYAQTYNRDFDHDALLSKIRRNYRKGFAERRAFALIVADMLMSAYLEGGNPKPYDLSDDSLGHYELEENDGTTEG